MTPSELDRLRRAYRPLQAPVPPATHARLDALIADAEPHTKATPRRLRLLGAAATRRRRPLLVAGAAAALALVALVAAALVPSGAHVHAPAAASARSACTPRGPATPCARALSHVALGYTLPGTGDVIYVRSTWVAVSFTVDDRRHGRGNHIQLAAARQPFEVVRQATEEYWMAPDGRGHFATGGPGAARLASAADEAAWRAAGAPDLETLLPPAGEPFQPLEQDVADIGDVLLGALGLYDDLPHDGDPLAPIPHDPAALAAWLRDRAWKARAGDDKGCRPDGDGCAAATRRLLGMNVVGDITTLLAYPATPPELAAALVRVLGELPGARALGLLRDEADREVAAISLPSTDTPDAVAIDPETGALRTTDVIALDPETGALRAVGTQRDGTIRWSRTYAVTAVRVPTLGARP